MTRFPSLHVHKKADGKFHWVISTHSDENDPKWIEATVSPMGYDNWMDAHIEGAEAVANLVMPRDYEDRETPSELPIGRILGRADS